MAIAVKTIDGKIVTPDGVGWAGGTIYFSLSVHGTVDDAGTEQIVAANGVTVIQSDGSVDFDLIPNDIITPADTVYIVKFFAPDGSRMTQHWRILTTDPSTINIGDVTRVFSSSGAYSAGTLANLLDTDVTGVSNDEVLTWNSTTEKWEPKPSSGAGSDSDAIHDNVAGEILLVSEKLTPDSLDLVLIEDSAAGHAKKRVKMSNLPGGAQAEYTTGGKPAANASNKNTPYVVKDPGEHAHGEIIYERDDTSFAYFITWRPF
ncbi:MAG: hypothetical protein OES34_11490 [Nitrosopumilus sp.]|nr:hypothetical protein [Nitrosopumilus sp.]